MTPVSRSDVQAALAQLRSLLHQAPPSGPNYPAEAAHARATEQMRHLAADEDPFLVECLEESFAACRGNHNEREVCWAIVLALRGRDALGAADVLGRIVLAEPPVPGLSAWVAEMLGSWNPRAFEAVLREAAVSSSGDMVRAWAAELLVAAGLATKAEIDGFLHDRDEGVRRLTTRGLAVLRTADAIVRLTEIALRHDDRKFRAHAWSLLGCCQLAPARGGEC